MRIVFMGTPTFASNILDRLADRHEVVAVYTRADAVRGRGKALVPTPVKEVALKRDIPVFTPKNFRNEADVAALREFQADVICVAAYGVILPQSVLDSAKYGCLNVHASLLPDKRGAAPIERGILEGDEFLGVCIMRMEAGLDTGDFACKKCLATEGLYADEATAALSDLGCDALLEALDQIETGIDWQVQDESLVTYASKIGTEDLILRPEDSADVNVRRVHASGEEHPCKTAIAGKGASILKARLCGGDEPNPGEGKVLYQAKRLYFGCKDGSFEIESIKPDGKKEMTARAFACGVQNIKSGQICWG